MRTPLILRVVSVWLAAVGVLLLLGATGIWEWDGGRFCPKCGPTVTLLVSLVSIVGGIAGVAATLRQSPRPA